MQSQACRRFGPDGRSLPERFYWRYTDHKCKPESRGTHGWPVDLLSGQYRMGLRAYISIFQDAGLLVLCSGDYVPNPLGHKGPTGI
eukprot:11600035-Alexandrium_andersonii.AAC.1